MIRYKIIVIIFFFTFSIFPAVFLPHQTYGAETAQEIQSKINEKNTTIQQLEEEIRKYQLDIDALGKQTDSLKNTLASLDLSKKKLQADLAVTQNKISATNLEIEQLSLAIDDKSDRIVDSKRVISQSLATIDRIDSNTLFENLIGSQSLSSTWNGAEELNIIQANITDRIHNLQSVRASLEANRKQTEKKKSELVTLTNNLKNQTKIIADTVKEKNVILAETKNTEANYNKLLATRKAQKEAFEREVAQLESALKIVIDPNSIPSTGTGILKYPLDTVRITQYFGNTTFATKNPQIYSGKGHSGIDFAASIGTPIRASLSGTVVGLGNMDLGGGGRCRAYGKWIMIKHTNGLSTLYAHLSLLNVSQGQEVVTGELVGYSGNTGATTGPHLHFGVYATQGVRITNLVSSSYCSGVLYPLADPKAYLNPLSFL